MTGRLNWWSLDKDGAVKEAAPGAWFFVRDSAQPAVPMTDLGHCSHGPRERQDPRAGPSCLNCSRSMTDRAGRPHHTR
jgi:hypothetical protein